MNVALCPSEWAPCTSRSSVGSSFCVATPTIEIGPQLGETVSPIRRWWSCNLFPITLLSWHVLSSVMFRFGNRGWIFRQPLLKKVLWKSSRTYLGCAAHRKSRCACDIGCSLIYACCRQFVLCGSYNQHNQSVSSPQSTCSAITSLRFPLNAMLSADHSHDLIVMRCLVFGLERGRDLCVLEGDMCISIWVVSVVRPSMSLSIEQRCHSSS